MRKCIRVFLCVTILVLILGLTSCESGISALEIAKGVSDHFNFKYGAIYSDEYDKLNEFCFSQEMKRYILGENAEKYTYIKSISGYFSRDMVSGDEFVIIEICDRSYRAEIMAVLYRRAAIKLDTDTRVGCQGNFVFFVCGNEAERISEYLKELI